MLSPLVSIPIFVIWFVIFYLFLKRPDDIVDSWIWLLRRIGLRSPATYALLGLVLGGAIGVNMFALSHLSVVMALCGLGIGLSFGLISNTKNDDFF